MRSIFSMALYNKLPVYRDMYQLILKVFDYTKDLPKEYKYSLGHGMKRDATELVRKSNTLSCIPAAYESIVFWGLRYSLHTSMLAAKAVLIRPCTTALEILARINTGMLLVRRTSQTGS